MKTLNHASLPAVGTGTEPAEESPRRWMAIMARYREPSLPRSIFEIAVTTIPLAMLWVTAWWSLSISYWLTLLLAVPCAGLLVRLFLIQHDCGHGAFFRQRAVNDWIGRIIGVVTMTPYDVWRHNHAIHHATSGNLDKRGVGDIDTVTVDEYLALPRWRRIAYRIYRNPLVMFGIGPSFVFMLQQRLPYGMMRGGWMPWISAMATNLGIAAFVLVMIWLVGAGPFLMVHFPIVALAASMGVWLFYVQHQFEDTFWADAQHWTHQEAALHGSSYYHLPPVLSWFTANIGVHHVHHLASRIPFYRLPQLLRDYPELAAMNKITLLESFKCVRLKLWDAHKRRLVSFADLRRERATGARAGRKA